MRLKWPSPNLFRAFRLQSDVSSWYGDGFRGKKRQTEQNRPEVPVSGGFWVQTSLYSKGGECMITGTNGSLLLLSTLQYWTYNVGVLLSTDSERLLSLGGTKNTIGISHWTKDISPLCTQQVSISQTASISDVADVQHRKSQTFPPRNTAQCFSSACSSDLIG